MKKSLLDANLLKKYHHDIFFNYSDYPTKDNWNYNFNNAEYKKSLADWLNKNKKQPVLFYVHTPFCEQLCYFCFCSKEITKNYEHVKNYLYNYLFKEIDLLFNFLNEKKIQLNVQEIYFGGGSPTYYKPEEFKKLINKLKNSFDFSKIGDFTVEIDPRRVDEERLLFYHECGVNRLSFGVQDFDLAVQKRINRIQPPELFDKLLTKKVRDKYKVLSFDLLVGLPGQTNESIQRTLDKVVEIRPTQIQPMLMHYDPYKRKYMIKMLKDGPLPDFFDRQHMFSIVKDKLTKAGYNRAGFESYALPTDPLTKAMNNEKALYASLGTQIGAATNFVSIGSSASGCLGNEYYSQNFYEQNSYRKCLNEKKLPIFRGMKLSEDDKIRRHIIQFLKTYFKLNFSEIENIFKINFKKYFKKEIEAFGEFIKDRLVVLSNDGIKITGLGTNFSPQIANVFDKYNRINASKDQLKVIERQRPIIQQ